MKRLVCVFAILCVLPLWATSLPQADSVLIMKAQRKLYLLKNGEVYRDYDISLGANPIGHKRHLGDKRTPEGRYIIDYRNAQSRFYRSLHISYPNKEDKSLASQRGLNPGGAIFIHGLPNGRGHLVNNYRGYDWTHGCIAVTNQEVDEIWAQVPNGTPIEIKP